MIRHCVPIKRRCLNADPCTCCPCPDIEGRVLNTDPRLGSPHRHGRRCLLQADPGLSRTRRHVRRCRCRAARSVQPVFSARADNEPIPQIRRAVRAVTDCPALGNRVAGPMPKDDAPTWDKEKPHLRKVVQNLIDPAHCLGKRHYRTLTAMSYSTGISSCH